ncbi:MAG TPA: SPOR domain-containing protein [Rubricoccaceae bacterium]|nr:SPOR domain-containing protein [Rubricoccaceae bacterium]
MASDGGLRAAGRGLPVHRPLSSVLCLLALLLAACSGPAGPSGPVGPEEPPPPDRPAYPAYETFDPSGYDAQPSAAPAAVEHDVPPRLMEGRVDVPGQTGERVVDGFRIQVFSSDSRDAAERVRSEAAAWWREVRGTAGAPSDLTPDVAYLQPYYRVRLGAFEFRDEAERALAFVRARWPEAFVVPDRVVIRE